MGDAVALRIDRSRDDFLRAAEARQDAFSARSVQIGWISTLGARGELNLAPYSYFNAFSSNPPIVGFYSEGDKDSSTFAMKNGGDSGRRLVLGRVIGVHVEEQFVRDGRVDSAAMRPIARGGYDEYSVVERVFSMPRPA